MGDVYLIRFILHHITRLHITATQINNLIIHQASHNGRAFRFILHVPPQSQTQNSVMVQISFSLPWKLFSSLSLIKSIVLCEGSHTAMVYMVCSDINRLLMLTLITRCFYTWFYFHLRISFITTQTDIQSSCFL